MNKPGAIFTDWIDRDDFARPTEPSTIAIVTDAWHPQVNGVVRTLSKTCDILSAQGHKVRVISPNQFRSFPAPSYPEIRLALAMPGEVGRRLGEIAPDSVHIATEGPLGLAARRYCVRKNWSFTTAYHTQFPDYLSRRTGLPPSTFWPFIRWFHRPASQILVATETIRNQLREQGLSKLNHWSRGVDLDCFNPSAAPPPEYAELHGPILLYVGRVAVEKNIEAFLLCDYPGTKVVVGVFPSKTDTFGLVIIEALACGTPVAAFPVSGPLDILTDRVGAMSDHLERAIDAARFCDRNECAALGAGFSWEEATRQFLSGLVSVDKEKRDTDQTARILLGK